jgi:hypothetical protein
MPRTITDEEGNQIEVPTEQELEELRNKAKAAEGIDELKEKAAQADELQKELEGLSDVRNLRKKTESYEKALEAKGMYLDQDTGEVKEKGSNEVVNNEQVQETFQELYQQKRQEEEKESINKMVESHIAKAAGGDEQIKQTIEAKYKLYSEGRDLTKEQAETLLNDATTAVLGRRQQRVHDFARAGSGYGGGAGAGYAPQDETDDRVNKAMDRLKAGGYKFKKKPEDIKSAYRDHSSGMRNRK